MIFGGHLYGKGGHYPCVPPKISTYGYPTGFSVRANLLYTCCPWEISSSGINFHCYAAMKPDKTEPLAKVQARLKAACKPNYVAYYSFRFFVLFFLTTVLLKG